MLAVGFRRPHVPLTAPKRFFDLYASERVTLPEVKPDDLDDVPPIAKQIAIANWMEPVGGMHRQITKHGWWRDMVRAYLACVSYVDDCVGRVLAGMREGPSAGSTNVLLFSDHGWALGEKLHWQKSTLWEEETRSLLILSTSAYQRDLRFHRVSKERAAAGAAVSKT